MSAVPKPLVSIVICAYDAEPYIGSAIESALSQTWESTEVIVVDDGSRDGTRDRMQAFGDRVVLVSKENGGQSSAYNVGCSRASGEIVIFLDGDDLLDADAVESVVSRFADGVARIHFRLRVIDAAGKPTGGVVPTLLSDDRAARSLERSGYLYASSPGTGNAYSRSTLERLLPVPSADGDKTGADFYLIYGAGLFGRIVAIDRTLASYRVHNRDLDKEPKGLIFGNSAQRGDEWARRAERERVFVAYVQRVSNGSIRLPMPLTDFSAEKEKYGVRVLSARTWTGRVGAARSGAGPFLRALRLMPNASLRFRLMALAWAMLLPLLPRQAAFRVGRYGANPSAR